MASCRNIQGIAACGSTGDRRNGRSFVVSREVYMKRATVSDSKKNAPVPLELL